MWKLIGLLGSAIRPFSRSLFEKEPVLSAAESSRLRELFVGHRLYQFEISSYSFKTRRTLAAMGVKIPEVDVLVDDNAYRELVEQGGKDQVPCLRINHPNQPTEWMYESDAILAYVRKRISQK